MFSQIQVLAFLSFPFFANGHGMILEPPSRNTYTNIYGLDWGTSEGVPAKEYCHHCLNRNTGVCGLSESGRNYDDWRDSKGLEMPWTQVASYSQGQTIEVLTRLEAHHAGHMELRGCPDGKDSTQACFDQHVFEFVEDAFYGMPKDPNYPERGYYWGGPTQNGVDFLMKFKIPDSLVGEKVLLQWLYVTANSCSPQGYSDYFGGANSLGQPLDNSFWTPMISTCSGYGANFMPLAPGAVAGNFGEMFVNCVEVAILPLDGPTTPSTPPPTAAPTLPPPPVSLPTMAPVTSPTLPPPPVSLPTTPPVNSPTLPPPPVSAPTTPPVESPPPGNFCCSNNYKDCNVSGWCAESKIRCEGSCGASWIEQGKCSGIPLWGDCTNDVDNCCAPATCQGNEWYKQCL